MPLPKARLAAGLLAVALASGAAHAQTTPKQ